jgi:hypothetical protein
MPFGAVQEEKLGRALPRMNLATKAKWDAIQFV